MTQTNRGQWNRGWAARWGALLLTERFYRLVVCRQPQLKTRTWNSIRPKTSIFIPYLFLVITLLISVHEAFGQDYQFLLKWGGDGQFHWPSAIAVDGTGNVYVADDRQDGIIQKFTSTGELITKWGSPGSGDGQLGRVFGIAVDSEGNVYTVDVDYCRVQKFTNTGEFLLKWGSFGLGDGQFYSPFGIAVDSSGNIYVADTVNNRVQKFTSTGRFITKWGLEGSEDGQFGQPRGIAVDSRGNVYVPDPNNSRVQKFTSTGEFITKWGSFGLGDGQFMSLQGIAVDSQDNVYVPDFSLDRIQKFTSTGKFITKWGSPGSGDGQFNYPSSIAVDTQGNIYVVDSQNYRIQVFGLTNPPPYALPYSADGVVYTDFVSGEFLNGDIWQFYFGGACDSGGVHRNPYNGGNDLNFCGAFYRSRYYTASTRSWGSWNIVNTGSFGVNGWYPLTTLISQGKIHSSLDIVQGGGTAPSYNYSCGDYNENGCDVLMYADVARNLRATLTVTISGSGTVYSTPGGINCGSDCSESYTPGTTVMLTATPADGYVFSGWGGACIGLTTDYCNLTMDANKSAAAEFKSLSTTAPLHDEDALLMTTSSYSNFATREYFNVLKINHSGTDLALSSDGTHTASEVTTGKPVYPICDGEVEFVYSKGGLYSFVKIRHHDCGGQDVVAYYGHLTPSNGTTTVTPDNSIGTVKDWNTNSHLHLTMDTNTERDLSRINYVACNYSLDANSNIVSLTSCNNDQKLTNGRMLLKIGWGQIKTVKYRGENGRLYTKNLYITENAIRQLGFISFFDIYQK